MSNGNGTVDVPITGSISTPSAPFGQQDLAELGALIAVSGLSPAAARAFVAKIQQVAIQVALASAPELIDQQRVMHRARMVDMAQQIAMLPNMMGYVRRDVVLGILNRYIMTNPPVN